MDVSFKDYITTFAKDDEFSQKPYAKFYSEAIDRHRSELLHQISITNSQRKKIIHNLRISEDELHLSPNNHLGKILNRERGTVIGGA